MPAPFTSHPILFEDENLIAIHKPPGVLSHPNPGQKGARSAFLGSYQFQERRYHGSHGSIWLIHRLDQETSGVLLAAKIPEAAEKCRKLFEENKVEKIYLALVLGVPKPAHGIWKDHLQKQSQNKAVRSTILRNRPPNAQLHYTVLQTFHPPGSPLLSLLKIRLLTGRTHQIRVQAASRNLPVLGDSIYGNFQLNRKLRSQAGLRRLFLHAECLNLRWNNETPRTEPVGPKKTTGLHQGFGGVSANDLVEPRHGSSHNSHTGKACSTLVSANGIYIEAPLSEDLSEVLSLLKKQR